MAAQDEEFLSITKIDGADALSVSASIPYHGERGSRFTLVVQGSDAAAFESALDGLVDYITNNLRFRARAEFDRMKAANP